MLTLSLTFFERYMKCGQFNSVVCNLACMEESNSTGIVIVMAFLHVRCYASVGISCYRACVRASHTSIVLKRLHESSWLFAYRFPLTHAMLFLREIRISPKIRVISLWNFVPNFGLRKFHHSTPTVGKCNENCDSGMSGVYSTSSGDRPTEDVHGTYETYWCTLHQYSEMIWCLICSQEVWTCIVCFRLLSSCWSSYRQLIMHRWFNGSWSMRKMQRFGYY